MLAAMTVARHRFHLALTHATLEEQRAVAHQDMSCRRRVEPGRTSHSTHSLLKLLACGANHARAHSAPRAASPILGF